MRCFKDNESKIGTLNVPEVTTTSVTEITSEAGKSGGNITNNGGATITSRGIVWSTNPSPTIADNSLAMGSGKGSFTSELNELKSATNYYVRSYATNSAGTAYGNEMKFSTVTATDDKITDADGNMYTSVTIGNQEWMTENLKTTKYSDGSTIPKVTDVKQWESLKTGAWCHYDNDNQYEITYGKLYNWYAVNTGKLCPTGWHVPSDPEWTVLMDYLSDNGLREAVALKSRSGWDYNGNGTDDYGWNALPGSGRIYYGFNYIGGLGYWWSSTVSYQSPTVRAQSIKLSYGHEEVFREDHNNYFGFSVRCLKN